MEPDLPTSTPHTLSSPHKTRSGPEFGPRPEAKALKWDELLPTTQRAMEELINWLDSARAKSQLDRRNGDSGNSGGAKAREEGSEEQLATSVLVSGDRGYGKTTLLLTTAYALRRPEEFLGLDPSARGDGAAGPPEPQRPDGAPRSAEEKKQGKRQELVKKLQRLNSHLVWLDPLDMEPLPTQANLLATLLVRVRNALDSDHQRQGRWAPPSLLEEGLDDPYGLIDRLVRNATFMWEDIAALGQDPRQRADQQIKAAEIYATFRRDFFSAMERVSGLLAERRFGHDSQEKTLLVLPIDNVDRSIQHLHLILKLTRMVASRRLWFVLAAGRSEFQLFLERTFQAELSSSGQAPLGMKGREETISIARRQAAAAMRRVLPHVHRIRIEHVSPQETWNFQAAPGLMGAAREPFKLYTFLSTLPLACKGANSHGLESFADLLDISKRLRCPRSEEKGQETKHQQGELLAEYHKLQRSEGNNEDPAASADGSADKAPSTERASTEDLAKLRRLLTEDDAVGLKEFFLGEEGQKRKYALSDKPSVPELRKKAIELLTGIRTLDKRPSPVFTYPARLALSLSARTALDFWQAAESKYQEWRRHREERDNHSDETCGDCQELAINIADTMLRTSIDESDLPGWASEQLHNRIMRTNARGLIVLDLTGKPVRRLKVTSLSDALEWNHEKDGAFPHTGDKDCLEGGSCLVRTELHLRHFQDDILELHDLERPGRRVPLPPNVAGWFMVLHDLLVFTKEQRVLNISVTPYDTTPAMAVTLHTVQLEPLELARLGFWWLPPNWDTFIDFAIFTTQWRAFLHRIQNLFEPDRARGQSVDETFITSRYVFLVAAWVDNVCAVANANRGGWCWEKLGDVVKDRDDAKPSDRFDIDKLPAYVEAVHGRVDKLYKETRSASIYGRLRMAQAWLDEALPMLLKPEIIPTDCLQYTKPLPLPQPELPTRTEEAAQALRALHDSALGKERWEKNQAFLKVTRRELVRTTLRSSELYQLLWQLYSGGTGSSLALRKWLQQATSQWLELTPEPTPR